MLSKNTLEILEYDVNLDSRKTSQRLVFVFFVCSQNTGVLYECIMVGLLLRLLSYTQDQTVLYFIFIEYITCLAN